ncbi:MAG: radical SAM family heme chaperone HemW [Phycisphaerales bacterium]|nr:radical SAM family heme chaperone HemW [Phycisphaerales bacterium]
MPSLPIHRPDASEILRSARPEGIYLHVPFCRHKCHYCDFYSLVDARDRRQAFTDRMVQELESIGRMIDGEGIRTVFIGGGTPTLLEPAQLERLLEAVRSNLLGDIDLDQVEWTIEANPETVDADCARALAGGGVNRVSVGCQSFDPGLLKVLERHHDPVSVPRAVDHLRASGIDRINLDLIFAIPGATTSHWSRDLDAALQLEPQHLSCYGLVFEPGTALTEKLRQGRIEPMDDELQNTMYDMTRDRLGAAGFEQYEISSWARPGEACLHNLLYWRNGDWIPVGPAAAGHVQGHRWRNLPRLDEWLDSGPFAPIVDLEPPDTARAVGEALMLGFRRTAGFGPGELDEVLQADATGEARRRAAIEAALGDGRLEQDARGIRFSRAGVLLADDLLAELL